MYMHVCILLVDAKATLLCVYKTAKIRDISGARSGRRDEGGTEIEQVSSEANERAEREDSVSPTVYRRGNLSFAWNSQHDRL